ncbi:hypothetical protein GCM10028817_18820 [Spirosoma pomorum]
MISLLLIVKTEGIDNFSLERVWEWRKVESCSSFVSNKEQLYDFLTVYCCGTDSPRRINVRA